MKFTNIYRDVVEKLTEEDKTLVIMESCTGGHVSSEITNIEGSSKIFKFGAITYSTETKILLGVNKEIIDEFGVYSSEVAREMSRAICEYINSDYGVGITGKLDSIRDDEEKEPNLVYVSVYDKSKDKYLINTVEALHTLRRDNKILISEVVAYMIKSLR